MSCRELQHSCSTVRDALPVAAQCRQSHGLSPLASGGTVGGSRPEDRNTSVSEVWLIISSPQCDLICSCWSHCVIYSTPGERRSCVYLKLHIHLICGRFAGLCVRKRKILLCVCRCCFCCRHLIGFSVVVSRWGKTRCKPQRTRS